MRRAARLALLAGPLSAVIAALGGPVALAASPPVPHPALRADAPASPEDAIVGRWATPGHLAVVEIVRQGNVYVGTVVESEKKPELVGKPILRGLVFDAARGTWSGKIYAVRMGEWVPVTMRSKDASTLAVTAGSGLLVRDMVWKR